MQLWRYFLLRDKSEDLADVDRAMRWLLQDFTDQVLSGADSAGFVTQKKNRFLLTVTAFFVGRTPNKEEEVEWDRAVRSLRSVARRVEGFAGRVPAIDPQEADRVMHSYVSQMVPEVLVVRNPHSRSNREVLLVTLKLGERVGLRGSFSGVASLFWQSVFTSMVPGLGKSVCGDCGVDLPFTLKGTVRRAARCKRCARKHWWNSLSQGERREREREKGKRRWANRKKTTQEK